MSEPKVPDYWTIVHEDETVILKEEIARLRAENAELRAERDSAEQEIKYLRAIAKKEKEGT